VSSKGKSYRDRACLVADGRDWRMRPTSAAAWFNVIAYAVDIIPVILILKGIHRLRLTG
jgi:hypothetical protein